MTAASVSPASAARVRREPVELDRGDERGGAAADTVEERDHLRHGRHPDEARRRDSDHRPDRHARRDQPVRVDLRRDEREHERDHHADGRDPVPRPGSRGVREPLDPDDEEDRRDRVRQVDDVLRERQRHRHPRSSGFRSEHLEHAIGDEEAADDVDRREHDGDERERLLETRVGRARDQHRPDEHDAVDRVRAGHERRVQERRHARDELEAEEDREREDRQAGDEARAHAGTASFSTRPSCVTHVSRTTSSSKSS